MSARSKSFLRLTMTTGAALWLGYVSSGCSSLEAYSARVARQAGACQGGWPTDDGPLAYPGDPEWPFERGLCNRPASGQTDVASVRK